MNANRRYSFGFLTQLGVRMGFLFLFLPALSTAVVEFADECIVHQGKESTSYNILNTSSHAKCNYSWADSNGTVLADDTQPNGLPNRSVSSSRTNLTTPKCLKKACVTLFCPLKEPPPTCCHSNCTAAQEPQRRDAFFSPTPKMTTHKPPGAGFWTWKDSAGIAVTIVVAIVVAIVVVIVVVIAVVLCCRKKENRFKRACRFNTPPGKEASRMEVAGRPEVIPMLETSQV